MVSQSRARWTGLGLVTSLELREGVLSSFSCSVRHVGSGDLNWRVVHIRLACGCACEPVSWLSTDVEGPSLLLGGTIPCQVGLGYVGKLAESVSKNRDLYDLCFSSASRILPWVPAPISLGYEPLWPGHLRWNKHFCAQAAFCQCFLTAMESRLGGQVRALAQPHLSLQLCDIRRNGICGSLADQCAFPSAPRKMSILWLASWSKERRCTKEREEGGGEEECSSAQNPDKINMPRCF